jgi:tetratricopeptide (TPR) repeat protein
MPEDSALSPFAVEVERIRELSKSGKHREAISAAERFVVEAPDNRDVLYLVAANHRCLNRISEALRALQRLEEKHPRFSLLYQERGHCYATLRDVPRAIDAFVRAVELNPALMASWSMLERLYPLVGDHQNAATAAEQVSGLKQLSPEVVRAGSLFSDGDLSAAEKILSAHLSKSSADVEALRLLARIEQRRNVLDQAEQHFEAVLKLAPDYHAARLDYVHVLIARQKYLRAEEVAETLLKLEPGNNHYLSLQAAACVGLGRHTQAIAVYRQILAGSPDSFELHVALGHSLKSVGLQKDAIESYQAATAVRPSFGDAYWSLANLKTYRFSQEEIDNMRRHESATAIGSVDRYHLCFALGKAYEDQNDHAQSWCFYERGNRLKRADSRYQPELAESNTRRQIEVCTTGFFAERAGVGTPDADPIFIVGLPRSGSTLVEQILASHSQVEGTRELCEIEDIARGLQRSRTGRDGSHYVEALPDLSPEDLRRLGECYLCETRAYRAKKPFFIDKMPNNFRHIGLIQLMLPNAKIIDVRRDPMGCCFSNLKQLFASGQEFTYSIDDIARYYRTYLDLMRHWDAVLPGRVLRVFYEDVVEDLDGSVRSILKYCGLNFEPACIEFHKTTRSIHTASSEQVRLPIFREPLDQWRNYETWLGPLKEALGDALVHYRQ